MAQRDADDAEGFVFTSASPVEGDRFSTTDHSSSSQATKLNDLERQERCPVAWTSIASSAASEANYSNARGQDDQVVPPPTPSDLVATQRLSPFASRSISLVVGADGSHAGKPLPITLTAHEDLLTSISPFFMAALRRSHLNGSFAEAHTGIIRLPDDRPDDVSMLLQWAYWQILLEKTQSLVNTSTATTASPTPTAKATSRSALLYHHSIDPSVHRYQRWKAEKRLLKETFGPSSPEVRGFKKQRKRPRPPAFGPLIRLYILADKYDVQGGLRADIVRRVEEVSKEANCVPDREDMDMLWDGLLEDVGCEGGLKSAVLRLFVGLDGRSLRGLFRDIGDGEGEEECVGWHPGFTRDLLLAMFEAKESAVAAEKEMRGGVGWRGLTKGR
ncbi:uncharacterized protein AB675_11538 [Cyphellophora attinorum]|uniref:BTB domain-containing protein n=1 Tax=Cyphellophora attinorum TaxID=1664694 RepID=A0A0N1P070_9EURO|nr:uncharacterized protein AB675_11538 [Phialophora attinorum]KPI39886.1 hypothetical protein AB675_11538 [Phialophora attinorum]